jgi:hypothetical protein
MQTNKLYTAHKQNQGQKSHDPLNTYRKTFDKIQNPFMIKALKKLEMERI